MRFRRGSSPRLVILIKPQGDPIDADKWGYRHQNLELELYLVDYIAIVTRNCVTCLGIVSIRSCNKAYNN